MGNGEFIWVRSMWSKIYMHLDPKLQVLSFYGES